MLLKVYGQGQGPVTLRNAREVAKDLQRQQLVATQALVEEVRRLRQALEADERTPYGRQ